MGERLTPQSLAGLPVSKVQEQGQFFNMLIYGDSGVGKTVLAGSASMVPEMSPVLFVDMEGGTMSLHATYPEVDTVRVKTWDEMNELYSTLFDGGHGYKTIVLDSLTEIQQFSMYDIMTKMVDGDPSRDPDIASQREWGKNLIQMRKYVRAFRDMPNMHTIFTSLAMVDKNQRTGKESTLPMLTGKFSKEVTALLDVVGYYYVKDVMIGDELQRERLLLTTKTDEITAKDRSGRLQQVVIAPTMQSLYDTMTAKMEPGANQAEVEPKNVSGADVTDEDISALTSKEKDK